MYGGIIAPMRSKTRTGVGLAFALLVTWGSNAHADQTTYPGSACQATGSSQDLSYSSSGPILSNGLATAESANCPIVRRNVFAGWQAIAVFVRDRNSAEEITCTVYADDPTGVAGGGWQETKTTVGEGDQTLIFGAPGVDVPNFGPYSLVCRLPPEEEVNQPSWIASYSVIEP